MGIPRLQGLGICRVADSDGLLRDWIRGVPLLRNMIVCTGHYVRDCGLVVGMCKVRIRWVFLIGGLWALVGFDVVTVCFRL